MSDQPVAEAAGADMAVASTCAQLARSLLDRDWSQAPATAGVSWPALLAALHAHGLLAGVGQRLRATALWPALDVSIRAGLESAIHQLAARELAGARALAAVDTAMAASKIDLVVFKGEALAAQVYPRPALRERMDIDLWVRAADFERAATVLTTMGYGARLAVGGEWLQPERSFVQPPSLGLGPALDLHRQLFSQALLARTLGFDEVFAGGAPLPGMRARAPHAPHALMIAAMHRIAHHQDAPDRLIWLLDIELIARTSPDACVAAATLAEQRGVAAILADTVRKTSAVFGSELLPPARIARMQADASHERSAKLLQPMSALRRFAFDLACLPDTTAKLRFLGETLFPSAEYLRSRFGPVPAWRLPWLYLRRAIGGLSAALVERKSERPH